MKFRARGEFFNRIDRVGFFAFFTRTEILPKEIRWSFGSAEQMVYPRETGDHRP